MKLLCRFTVKFEIASSIFLVLLLNRTFPVIIFFFLMRSDCWLRAVTLLHVCHISTGTKTEAWCVLLFPVLCRLVAHLIAFLQTCEGETDNWEVFLSVKISQGVSVYCDGPRLIMKMQTRQFELNIAKSCITNWTQIKLKVFRVRCVYITPHRK